MRKSIGFLVLAAACAACCAPLLLPILGGVGTIGALGLANFWGLELMTAIGIGAVIFLLAGLFLFRRRAQRKSGDHCAIGGPCAQMARERTQYEFADRSGDPT